MNLDDLKIQLNQEAAKESRSQERLTALLNNRPSSPVNGILKSLRLEIIISLVFIFACIYFALFAEIRSLQLYFGIFVFVGALFLIVLSFLYNRTKKYLQRDLPVRENLSEIIHIIETYCKYYFRFSVALMPICVFLAFALSDQNMVERFVKSNWLIPFSLIIVVGAVLLYYANRWTINKLYGRYLAQMKSDLQELNVQDE